MKCGGSSGWCVLRWVIDRGFVNKVNTKLILICLLVVIV